MAATIIGAAKVTFNGGTSVSTTYNQTPTAGNLLIAGVYCEMGSATACSTPAGWTAGPTGGLNYAGYYGTIYLFWKVAAGGDAAPTFTVTANNTTVVIEEWSGLRSVAPFDVGSTVGGVANPGAAGNANSGPVTTTANDLIWSFNGAWGGSSGAPTLVWGGGSSLGASFYNPAYWSQVSTARQVSGAGTYTPTLAYSSNVGFINYLTASMAFKSANTAPNAPTLNSPATGTTVDMGVTQRLAWTFSDPDAGDTQSKFDLQYRLGAGAWTTVTGTTPNSWWDAVAGTFTAGNWEWQVRTYDAVGTIGPWSASSFFTATNYLSTGATRPTTVTVTATGAVGRSTVVTFVATVTTVATGSVGLGNPAKTGDATTTLTATTTSSGTVGLTAGTATATTVTVTASGTVQRLSLQMLTIITPERMPDLAINPPNRTTLILTTWSAT